MHALWRRTTCAAASSRWADRAASPRPSCRPSRSAAAPWSYAPRSSACSYSARRATVCAWRTGARSARSASSATPARTTPSASSCRTARRPRVTNALGDVQASVGHLCLYLGFTKTAAELALPKANYWIYPDEHHERNVDAFDANPDAPFPVVYVSFPAAKDPDLRGSLPGRSTIDIITMAPYRWFERWQDTRWHHRGDDYDGAQAAASPTDCSRRSTASTRCAGAWPHRPWELLHAAHHAPLRRLGAGRALRPRPRPVEDAPALAAAANEGPGAVAHGTGHHVLWRRGAMMGGLAAATAIAGLRRMAPVMKDVFG